MRNQKQKKGGFIRYWFGLTIFIMMLGAILGACASNRGPYDQLIKENQKAIRENPMDAEAYMRLGQLYIQKSEYRDALEVFLKRRFLEPKDIKVEYYIGVCYDQLGYFSQALDQYRKIKPVDKKLADQLLKIITH